jgi:hypothetical protein
VGNIPSKGRHIRWRFIQLKFQVPENISPEIEWWPTWGAVLVPPSIHEGEQLSLPLCLSPALSRTVIPEASARNMKLSEQVSCATRNRGTGTNHLVAVALPFRGCLVRCDNAANTFYVLRFELQMTFWVIMVVNLKPPSAYEVACPVQNQRLR